MNKPLRSCGGIVLVLAILVSAMAVESPLIGTAIAAPVVAGGSGNLTATAVASVSGSGSSDATASLSQGGTLSWSLSPSATPNLITVSCAAFGPGVILWATYGNTWMTSAINYTYYRSNSGLYVGIFYLNSPASGTQNAVVTLYKANTTTLMECSATAWTGAAGVDTTLWGHNWEWGTNQAYITITPARTVPANEVFFSALSRYQYGTSGTTLSVAASPSGASASIVDSNTYTGSGLGHGCQAAGSSDVDCIASAQLGSGGTSMQFSWTNGAFAVAAGIGIEVPIITLWGPGYMGNSNLYLTAGLTDLGNPIMFLTQWSNNTGTQSPFGSVTNALSFALGQDQNTPMGGLIYKEVFAPGSPGVMQVYMPYAADGGTTINQNTGETVHCTGVFFTVSNGPYSVINFETQYDSGINATGTVPQPSQDKSQELFSLGMDALGFLPGAGFAVGAGQTMLDLESLIETMPTSNPAPGSTSGTMTGSLYYDVVNGSYAVNGATNQNVFTSQGHILLTIPQTDFSSYVPAITVTAQNYLGPYGLDCGSSMSVGTTSQFSLNAYPAGAIQGTVYIGGHTYAPNSVINFFQIGSGSAQGWAFRERNSNLMTGSGKTGMYAFAGQPGAAYSVYATYQTPFGTILSPAQPITAPASPGLAASTSDLYVPAPVIKGQVTYGGAGYPYAGVFVINPAGAYSTIQADGNGNYLVPGNLPGKYQIIANGGTGYGTGTYTLNHVAMNTTTLLNLPLNYTKPPGGCILAGTNVTTPNGGQKRVEQLSQGDAILGYNVSSRSWVKEKVTSNTATTVKMILSVNNGLLYTTLTDQPLYVGNGTWVGWVHDPVNLSVGEFLYDPLTTSWTAITSLQTLQGTYTVYDLRVTAPNDFVANGLLALDKRG